METVQYNKAMSVIDSEEICVWALSARPYAFWWHQSLHHPAWFQETLQLIAFSWSKINPDAGWYHPNKDSSYNLYSLQFLFDIFISWYIIYLYILCSCNLSYALYSHILRFTFYSYIPLTPKISFLSLYHCRGQFVCINYYFLSYAC